MNALEKTAVTNAPRAIVGIGASAGGLEAFRLFFEKMPPGHGFAFVVILHLPADRKSMLPDILARWTPMQVVEATDGIALEKDCIYVPPPQAAASLHDGCLRIAMPAAQAPRDGRLIDHFFNSLARELREAAIGCILSGTGSDGALGLKAIKAVGGLTIVQGPDGNSPEFDGMPAGAIATGAVDVVAAAAAMPGHLIRLAQTRPGQAAPHEEPSAEALEGARLAICGILHAQLNHDFSGYKDRTFMRRVQRRMQVLNISAATDYVARLEWDRDETVLLFRDLLIRVTSFFRDAEAFAALSKMAIPRLFKSAAADGVIRVWVAGCATGEEAYSLAILLREHMDGLAEPPQVQVFATDIDGPAIATARAGRYPGTLLEGLSQARRERFFNRTTTGFVVSREIRELCTFSEHSLIRDPPFSRINLISCRNLLIYMDNDLQTRVIPAFHFALVPGGILLLGSSETASRHEELFEPLDKAARIFERRNVRSPSFRLFARGRNLQDRQHGKWGTHVTRHASLSQGVSTVKDHLAKPPQQPGGTGGASVKRASGAALRHVSAGWLGRAIGRISRSAITQELHGLRRQLRDTEAELQSITEEHETAVEELRSSNEELQSVNEEFQSTNEELETSKEEIQSVNEELHTLNTQLSDKLEELDRTNNDLKNLFESTDVATIFLDRNMLIRGYTPAVSTIYNLIPSDHGRPLTDIVNHLAYRDLRVDMSQVLTTQRPVERRVGHEDGKTHYILRVLPYRGGNSQVSGVLVTFLDVSSVVLAEQHQRLLVDELNHRVKNMLTVVISLAQQTLRRSGSMESFSTAFLGRVHALTASYMLLSREHWAKVSLRDILIEETKPFISADATNLSFSGPLLLLGPQGALALGMAVHELATNAVKYGALSVPEGLVSVIWQVNVTASASELVLDWIEQGGPHVNLPSYRGFGMTLIERGFAHELSGSAHVAFDTDGVRARLRAPIGGTVSTPEAPVGSVA